jgi:hypothetical protein
MRLKEGKRNRRRTMKEVAERIELEKYKGIK